MSFFQLLVSCNDPGLSSILYTVKKIVSLIQIIAPILLIVMGAIHLINLVKNPDDKKRLKKVQNSLIAAVMIFIIPTIVNATMYMLDDSFIVSDCWNNATSRSMSSTYQSADEEDSDKKKIYINPGDYQTGTPKPSSSSSSSTGGSSGPSSTSSTGDSPGEGNPSANNVIFIGDSRTVQMYAYLNNNWKGANYSSGGIHVVGNDIYISEGGKGLSWMKSTGIPAAKKYFTSGSAIVILMGVNDLSNADKYISYVNENAASWKSNGSSLYFVSVNPCDGKYSHLNSKIDNFNSKLKSGLSSSVGWIDTCGYLNSSGFKTTDGLHYNKETSEKIYNYIKSRV